MNTAITNTKAALTPITAALVDFAPPETFWTSAEVGVADGARDVGSGCEGDSEDAVGCTTGDNEVVGPGSG